MESEEGAMKKRVQNNGKTTGGVTGKGFMPGKSGNPGGRPAMSDAAREYLAANTRARVERLERLATDAEESGDLKTAAHIELSLLKKTMPDATELVVSMPEGLTVRTVRIDPRKLTAEQLAAVHAAQTAGKADD